MIDADNLKHPLDPCSADELTRAVAILRDANALSSEATFACGFPAEPPKEMVLQFEEGMAFDRVIRLIGHDRLAKQSFDALVSLSNQALVELNWIEDGQAPVSVADYFRLLELINASDEWADALRKRGIEDLSLVHVEPWVAGVRHPEMHSQARAMRALAFVREKAEDNYYAKPIEGLIAYLDLDDGKVIVEEHGVVPIPNESSDYAAAKMDGFREDIKPIEITQPEGPSFTVKGHVIEWQKWKLRIAVNPIEGLVLYDVRYKDEGRDRPILYRASLSDMVVPYGDASPMHNWKHAFDGGEALIGYQGNSLKRGCDCLGEIYYFDNTMLRPDGEPELVENVVCLHEEDFGILWKHTNVFNPGLPPEVRRKRRLVVSMIHTIGNYEYGFFWYFYQDGSIQLEAKLTGIVAVSAVTEGSDMAPLVAPGIASPLHQHLFCFRLDFNIDGGSNTVSEVDVEPLAAGPQNPLSSYYRTVSRVLRSEQEAQRALAPERSRSWQVMNPNVTNSMGNPVAYKLLAQASPSFLSGEGSWAYKRAGFARHNLWVTPYAQDELYADAGPFTNLHSGNAGLPVYTQQDRNIENTDVVLWHTFGVTHVPRPEDWPVMPVEYAGFMLMPVGFFDRNPALDVPPSGHCDGDG